MPKFKDLKKSLKSATDFVRQVRNPRELAQLAVPFDRRERRVLNEGPMPESEELRGLEVVRSLKKLRNRLKAEAYVVTGGVDYAKLANSEVFEELEQASRALRSVDPAQIEGDAERVAFWINLYNVLMIHGVIALEIKHSVREIPTFFTTVAYALGDQGLSVTPDDIEHGLLRRNTAHPSSGNVFLSPDDPRKDWMPSYLEPRIHVALVCVAASCPPIGFYDPERLEAQLDIAAQNFVNGASSVDHETHTLTTSPIFQWYQADFGGRSGLEDFLLQHADEALRDDLERALENDYDWSFPDYDWSLNTL